MGQVLLQVIDAGHNTSLLNSSVISGLEDCDVRGPPQVTGLFSVLTLGLNL